MDTDPTPSGNADEEEGAEAVHAGAMAALEVAGQPLICNASKWVIIESGAERNREENT